jgi:hypothetical protein
MSWRERAVQAPWYPIVLVAAYILTLWIDSGVSFFATWRALAVSVIGVGIALVLLAALTRRPHLAGAVVTAAVAVLISRGAVGLAGTAALLVAVPSVLLIWSRIRGTPFSAARMTRSLNVLSLFILAVVLVGGIPRGSYAALIATDLRQGADELPSTQPTGAAPSILVILLDGYRRADALEAAFGHDNGAFVRGLEDRGFRLATQSESNYPYTQATLISMLHMRPLDEIAALASVETGAEAQYPRMRQVANDNPVFAELRSRGYLVVATSPGYEHVTLRQADVFLDNGALNEPERHLIRGTTLQYLIDAVDPNALADQHRQRIEAGLDYVDQVAGRLAGGSPTFAFLHVPSPHIPVVMDASGGLLADPPSDAEFRRNPISGEATSAYANQLTYLNDRVLDAIDRAPAVGSENEPIIVVMSDHGAEPPPLDGESWTQDHYANFLAIRVPASVDMALPRDTTPINLFPRLFAAMFGSGYREWPDEQFPWIDVAVPAAAAER